MGSAAGDYNCSEQHNYPYTEQQRYPGAEVSVQSPKDTKEENPAQWKPAQASTAVPPDFTVKVHFPPRQAARLLNS